jgi:monofunctional biosynthetic peptidoglycan transglycosylase
MRISTLQTLATVSGLTVLLAGCGKSPPPVSAIDDANQSADSAGAVTLYDFESPADLADWRTVDDNVMGGVSSGRIDYVSPGVAAFAGTLSLENNGGFSTVRTRQPLGDLTGKTGLELRVRGDGRRYTVFAKTNDKDDGYLYQRDIQPQAGRWQAFRVPFADMNPRYRGIRLVLWPGLSAGDIRGIGVMIADKQPGPFRLEIDSVSVY